MTLLTSTAPVAPPTPEPTIVSGLATTVSTASTDKLATDVAAAIAAASPGGTTVLASEVALAIKGLIKSLDTKAGVTSPDLVAQLASASPAVNAFVTALQKSVVELKKSSATGLALSEALLKETITQAQFNSQVAAIPLTTAQLEAVTAANLPGQTSGLVFELINTLNLKPTVQQTSTATPALPTAGTKLPGKTPALPTAGTKLPGAAGGGTPTAKPTIVGAPPKASAESVATLISAANLAAADSIVLPSEVTPAVQKLIESLDSQAGIKAPKTAEQLASAASVVSAFTTAMQQSIVSAKENTTAGLLASQALLAGTITKAQFEAAISAITLTTAQLESVEALNLPQQTFNLVIGLINILNLNPTVQQTSSFAAKPIPTLLSLPLTNDPVANPLPPDPEKSKKLLVVPPPPALPPLGWTPPNPPLPDDKLASAVALTPLQPSGYNQEGFTFPEPPSNKPLLQQELKDDLAGLSWFEKALKVAVLYAANVAEQNLKASAASLLSLNPQPKIMTGARAVLKLNGKIIALCNHLQYEISSGWSEIKGIDELIPNDLAPTSYSISGTMSIYRVPNKSPISNFWHTDMFRSIIWPYLTIEIRDKRTDELIIMVKRAMVTSRAESFSKGQLTSSSLSFVGIDFRDEQVPEVLPNELSGTDNGLSGIFGNLASAVGSYLP